MKRDPRVAFLLLAPSLVLLVVLFYLPQLLLFVVSLGHRSAYGGRRADAVARELRARARAPVPRHPLAQPRARGLHDARLPRARLPVRLVARAPRPGPLAQRPPRARRAAVLDELPRADVRVDRAAALGGAREPRARRPRAAARGAALQRLRRAGGTGLRRAAVHDRPALRLAREARQRARRGRRRLRRLSRARVLERRRAADAAGHRRRLPAGVHSVARRLPGARSARRRAHRVRREPDPEPVRRRPRHAVRGGAVVRALAAGASCCCSCSAGR